MQASGGNLAKCTMAVCSTDRSILLQNQEMKNFPAQLPSPTPHTHPQLSTRKPTKLTLMRYDERLISTSKESQSTCFDSEARGKRLSYIFFSFLNFLGLFRFFMRFGPLSLVESSFKRHVRSDISTSR